MFIYEQSMKNFLLRIFILHLLRYKNHMKREDTIASKSHDHSINHAKKVKFILKCIPMSSLKVKMAHKNGRNKKLVKMAH